MTDEPLYPGSHEAPRDDALTRGIEVHENLEAVKVGLKLELAASMLREMINLCELGDLDETTNDGLGWAGLIEDAKKWLSDQPAQNFVPRRELDAANDAHRRMAKAEHDLSHAYVRLRLRIPGALATPSGQTPEQMWQHTEACLERMARQAYRYEFIRQQNWSDGDLCVVANPKRAVKLGHDCPFGERLDELIDGLAGTRGISSFEPAPPVQPPYQDATEKREAEANATLDIARDDCPIDAFVLEQPTTPSVHGSIEADCFARNMDWESYRDAHRKSDCKGGLLCREAYDLFCQAMQAQMWYDQSGHGITVFTKDAEVRDQAAHDARRAKLQEVTDKLSNLRRATIGNVVHYLDETGQTVATVSKDLLDEHSARRASPSDEAAKD